jgi:hypothetical protein
VFLYMNTMIWESTCSFIYQVFCMYFLPCYAWIIALVLKCQLFEFLLILYDGTATCDGLLCA